MLKCCSSPTNILVSECDFTVEIYIKPTTVFLTNLSSPEKSVTTNAEYLWYAILVWPVIHCTEIYTHRNILLQYKSIINMVLKRNVFTKIPCVLPLPPWHALPSLQKKKKGETLLQRRLLMQLYINILKNKPLSRALHGF